MIHFTSPEGQGPSRGSAISSASTSNDSGAKGAKGNATVKVEKLANYKRKIRVNNEKDKSRKVLTIEKIKENMRQVLDNPELVGQYNLIRNNCEHFANFIRYGFAESDQVKNHPVTALFAGMSWGSWIISIGIGKLPYKKKKIVMLLSLTYTFTDIIIDW